MEIWDTRLFVAPRRDSESHICVFEAFILFGHTISLAFANSPKPHKLNQQLAHMPIKKPMCEIYNLQI